MHSVLILTRIVWHLSLKDIQQVQTMEELIGSIIYGRLEVEIPQNLVLKQQLEIVRAIITNPSSLERIKLPKDIHPYVQLLISEIKVNNNGVV
jgi:hypothetical protein